MPPGLTTMEFSTPDKNGSTLDNGCSSSEGDNELSAAIDWTQIPMSLDPADGELQAGRAARKRRQVEALVRAALPTTDRLYTTRYPPRSSDLDSGAHDDDGSGRIHVCDFGSGSGHEGLLLAFLRPRRCFVTLLERRPCNYEQAGARLAGLREGAYAL